MTAYATLAQFYIYGLPEGALADMDTDTIQAVLESVSREVDSRFYGRQIAVPLTMWGDDITSAVCRVAAPRILFNARGASPLDPAHQGLIEQSKAAERWLDDISAGRVTPTGLSVTRGRQGAITVVSTDEERGW